VGHWYLILSVRVRIQLVTSGEAGGTVRHDG
jgi:hypothetical protein